MRIVRRIVRRWITISATSLVCAVVVAVPVAAGELYELDGGRDAAIYGYGVVAGLGARHFLSSQVPLTPEELADLDVERINRFDRVAARSWSMGAARTSDYLLYGMAVAPLLLLAETGASMSSGELLVMYTQTQLVQFSTASLLKTVVGRTRPYAYNRDPRIPEGYRQRLDARHSFPSGHTSTTFASAVFMGEVFARLNPDDSARHWVRGGSLALAVTTGYLRVRAGRHFPSDVLAGAAIGALVGWLIPRLHEVDPESEGAGGANASFAFGFAF